ncbi:MAG: caspase family protein [Crocinitomicaceae bacterium]|nr:caspase family protein [Crocinitomicaceae bacterium]
MKYFSLLLAFAIAYGLSAQENPVLVVSSGHHSTMMCVDISPDGKFVASGASDNLVKIYDMQMQQELNTFTRHSRQIESVDFSKDGNYIVSASQQEIMVHSHPEGEFINRIEIGSLNSSFYKISADNRLYIGNDDTGIQVYNLLTGELERTLSNIEVDMFELMPDDKTLIATTRNEEGVNGVGFYSLPEGTLTDFMPVEGILTERYDVSRDGKTIALEISGCGVKLIDVKTKTVTTTVNGGVGMLNIMKLSPDGKQLLTSTFDNFVRFWDARSGNKIKEIADLSPSEGGFSMSMAIKDMDFSDDGKMSVYCYSDLIAGRQFYTVEWFDAKTMKSIGKHQGDVKLSLSISVDHSGRILSTGTIDSEMGVKCFDIAKGSQRAFLPGMAYHSVGGRYLVSSSFAEENSTPLLNIYSMPAVRLVKSIEVYSYGQMTMSPSGKYVTVIDVKPPPGGDYSNGAMAIPFIRTWEVSSGKEIVHIERTIATMPRTCLFPDGDTQMVVLSNGMIETIDLATGKVINSVETKSNTAYNHLLSPDGTKIIGSSIDGLYELDIETGERTIVLTFDELTIPQSATISKDKTLIAVAVMKVTDRNPYQVLVYDWETKSLVCELVGHTTLINQLVIGPKNKHLYSVDNNGIIAMWNLNKCKIKASFLAFGAEDYLIISPDGYYKTSKGNVANIGFRQNGGLYTFDQFDLRYNRPDKVLESIGMASEEQIAMYTKAYHKRLKRMGFSEGNFSDNVHAPEISIVGAEALPLNTTAGSIDLGIKATDASVALDRLTVTVNGIPIYGKLGKRLKAKNSLTYEENVNIPLVAGVNLIQVSVMNLDGTESVRKTYSIDCKKKIVKPDLYIVAIGVRDYQDSSMNLTYPDKDVSDLVDLFVKNQGASGLYNEVHVVKMTNEEVLKETVISAREMLDQSKVDDQIVLFYSGHGLLDENMDYFLATYDVEFASPSARGLPFADFRDLIDGVPARNRLVLVDACHSGEVDRDEVVHAPPEPEGDIALNSREFAVKGKKVIGLGNSFELMKELFVELRKESGATIIASSAGTELSLESAKWKNGVFTFTLKEALLERKADFNNDDIISVSELKRYLFIRVKELTDGKQTPTVRRENLQHDYNIY